MIEVLFLIFMIFLIMSGIAIGFYTSKAVNSKDDSESVNWEGDATDPMHNLNHLKTINKHLGEISLVMKIWLALLVFCILWLGVALP